MSSQDTAAVAGVPNLRRAYTILFACLVAVGMGQTIVFAILPPLGREIGFAEWQVGAIVSASSITFFIASPIWGRVSDRWGRKKVLLTGLVGYTLGTVVFASGFWVVLAGLVTPWVAFGYLTLSRMAQSSVMSATPPAAAAYVADVTDVKSRTRGMGGIGAANNIGAILGPALGGLLAGFSLLLPLYAAAGLTLIAAVAVFFLLPEPRRHAHIVPRERLRYTDPRILPFIIVGVLMFSGFAIVQQTLAFRFQDVLGLDGRETARLFGFSMMFMGTCSLIAQGIIVQRMDLSALSLLRIAMPLLIIAFVVMAATDSRTALFLAMGVLGLGMGLAGPGFMAGASLAVTPGEQGAVAGVAGSCGPLGFTIGPLSGTLLYQVDPHLPYLLTAIIYVPLLVFVWRVRLHRGNEDIEGQDAS
jgi:MFS family permease